MRADNPVPIKLSHRDWPAGLTFEQSGVLIELVFYLWVNQCDLNAEAARKMLRLHPAKAAKVDLCRLLSDAKELTRQRAAILPEDRKIIALRANGVCHYCGSPIGDVWHVDHADPVSRGGKNKLDNYRAACVACNQAKGTMTEPEFVAHLKGGGHARA